MPRSPGDALQQVERVCQGLKERFGAGTPGDQGAQLRWEWDGGFSAALAVATDPQHHAVLAALEELFAERWDHQRVREAPARIARLCADCGGLRPGQLMLTLEPDDDPLLFVLWWPWGCGTKVSLRVGCEATADEARALEPLALLKRCFGI